MTIKKKINMVVRKNEKMSEELIKSIKKNIFKGGDIEEKGGKMKKRVTRETIRKIRR